MSTDSGGLTTQLSEEEALAQIEQANQANINPSDIIVSRMALLQPQSPEIVNEQPGYKMGMIVDSQTREILSDYILPPWLIAAGVPEKDLEEVHCLPIAVVFKLPTEYIKWIPVNDREAYRAAHPGHNTDWEWKTLDRNDPKVKEGTWASLGGTFTGKKPPVTDNTNYLVLPINLASKQAKSNFIVQTFSRTSTPAGKQLTALLAAHRMNHLAYWDRLYWLYTKKHTQDQPKQTWFTYEVARGPLFKDAVDLTVRADILQYATHLSDPKLGKQWQELMINSAVLGSDTGGTDTSFSSGNSGMDAADDPFSADKKEEFPQ
jgi:hypothetical protein